MSQTMTTTDRTEIILYHSHYDEKHLVNVKREMVELGRPIIRCIYDETTGCWQAIEGCHRLRAAESLGILPIIHDISEQSTVTMQRDGRNVRMTVKAVLRECIEDRCLRTVSAGYETEDGDYVADVIRKVY